MAIIRRRRAATASVSPMPDVPFILPGQTIAQSDELRRWPTKKFKFQEGPHTVEAFLVRFGERIFAYRNQCRHISLSLDWMENEFFDKSERLLMCRNHGALFEPESGLCIDGPCRGSSLFPVEIDCAETGEIRLSEMAAGSVES